MNKPLRLALVLHSVGVLYPVVAGMGIVGGGGNKVNKALLEALIADERVALTVITLAEPHAPIMGLEALHYFQQSIYTSRAGTLQEIETFLINHPQDAVLFSDVITTIGSVLLQSHSVGYRRGNEPWWIQPITRLVGRKRIIQQQQAFGNLANTPHRQVFAVSEGVKQGYIQHCGVPEQQCCVAYPGVVQPTAAEVANARLTQPIDTMVFGMVNTTSFNKGGWVLLVALGLLRWVPKMPPFKVIMVHPKWEKDAWTWVLVRLLGLHKLVQVLPFQPDMTLFYQAIDVLILPSLNEAFGLVVLEAMSYGVVPVVSSTAGVAEIIEHAKNGFVFNRKQQPIWQLYKVLKQLLYNPVLVKTVGETAIKTSKQFTWQHFTDTIVERLQQNIERL
jgi:glycosyltransferase involved in cell wall biosynthesis